MKSGTAPASSFNHAGVPPCPTFFVGQVGEVDRHDEQP